jgi:hypothetical protein
MQAPKRFVEWLAAFLLAIVILAVGAAALVSAAPDFCDYQPSASIVSPDQRYIADVTYMDCGHAAHYQRISVRRFQTRSEPGPGRAPAGVEIASYEWSENDITPYWQGNVLVIFRYG